jgi:hypothetical protein
MRHCDPFTSSNKQCGDAIVGPKFLDDTVNAQRFLKLHTNTKFQLIEALGGG